MMTGEGRLDPALTPLELFPFTSFALLIKGDSGKVEILIVWDALTQFFQTCFNKPLEGWLKLPGFLLFNQEHLMKTRTT